MGATTRHGRFQRMIALRRAGDVAMTGAAALAGVVAWFVPLQEYTVEGDSTAPVDPEAALAVVAFSGAGLLFVMLAALSATPRPIHRPLDRWTRASRWTLLAALLYRLAASWPSFYGS